MPAISTSSKILLTGLSFLIALAIPLQVLIMVTLCPEQADLAL